MENVRKKRIKKEDRGYGYKSIFPAQLRELLETGNVKQDELAGYCDVSRQSVAQWKDGKTMPDIYYFKKIADFFKVPYEYLLDGIPTKKAENVDINRELGLSDEAISSLKHLKKAIEVQKSGETCIEEDGIIHWYGEKDTLPLINFLIEENLLLKELADYFDFNIASKYNTENVSEEKHICFKENQENELETTVADLFTAGFDGYDYTFPIKHIDDMFIISINNKLKELKKNYISQKRVNNNGKRNPTDE